MNSLREYFLIDRDVIFFNHGSFGACPRPVFESYQYWQLQLERNPVSYFARRAPKLLEEARAALGQYLHTSIDNLVYVVNATFGTNIILRSLQLQPGDEVLTTDHEYGAVNNNWDFMSLKLGFNYIHQHIPLPVTTDDEFVEQFWKGVTPHTRVISLSHITSPTALIFPIEKVIKRAREAGIITVIDGAHAPGQIPLNLDEIGADFYVGNLHKWLCAPKGSAFLYARPEMHKTLEPLVVHGWRKVLNEQGLHGSLVDLQQGQGTRDYAAFLATPDAIKFQNEHNWEQVRADCHALAADTQKRILDMYGLQPFSPLDARPAWWSQMVAIPLPNVDLAKLSKWLIENYKIEIPVKAFQDHPRFRLSVQAYNTREETDILVEAIRKFVSEQTTVAA
jgi:isopenicillin-N epimerase